MTSSHDNPGARRNPPLLRPEDAEADSNGGLEIEIDLDLSGEEPPPRAPLRPASPPAYPAQTPSTPRGARYQPTLQPPPPMHRAGAGARATPPKLPSVALPPQEPQHEDLSEIFAAADPLAFGVEVVPDDLPALGISEDFDPWADLDEAAPAPPPVSIHNERTNPGSAALSPSPHDLLDEDGLGDYGRQLMALGELGLDDDDPFGQAPPHVGVASPAPRPARELPVHARSTRELPLTPAPDADAAQAPARPSQAPACPSPATPVTPAPTPAAPSRPSHAQAAPPARRPMPTPTPPGSSPPSAGFAALARPTPRSKTLESDTSAAKAAPAPTPSRSRPQAEVFRRASSISSRPASIERPALVEPEDEPSVTEEGTASGRSGILRRQSSKPQKRPDALRRPGEGQASAEEDLQRKLERAQVLRRGGLHEEAEALLRELLQFNPDNSQIRHLFALNEENRVERTIARLGDLSVVPRLLTKPQELMRRELDSRLGYLITLIDGLSTLQDILELSPMNEEETAELLLYLRKQGIMSGGGR